MDICGFIIRPTLLCFVLYQCISANVDLTFDREYVIYGPMIHVESGEIWDFKERSDCDVSTCLQVETSQSLRSQSQSE